jgi:hypothetical protein
MEGTGKNLRLPANPPYFTEGQRTYDATTGAGTSAIGFADVVAVGGGVSTLYRVFAKDLRPQMTKQWNIFVERKLTDSLSAQMGYVGSRATHMVVPFDFNQPEPGVGDPSTWAPLQQRRPLYPLNPNIGTTSGTNSIGIGAYDGLQTSLRQRTKGGLEFLASYTYSKSLSDNVGYYGTGWGQTGAQGYYYMDSTDPRRDYGRSTYDARHNFTLAGTYELPFGKGRKMGSDWSGAKNAVLGNWDLHSIFQMRSGFAFTVYDGAGQSLQSPRGLERPNQTCSGKTNASGPNDIWIDINCFQRAPKGSFGNTGQNTLSGPGYWNLDLGVSKNLYVDDRRYLTLRVEAFNALNHANFSMNAGASDISNPGDFGKILNTFSAPRIIELVVKFNY